MMERIADVFLDWFEGVFFSRGFDRFCTAVLVLIGGWFILFVFCGVV